MGASVSTNVSETTKKITNNISNKQASIATATSTQRANMSITGNTCGGDLTVSGITISNEATVDLKQTAMGMTDSSIQNQMAAQLKAAALAANEELNLLQVSVATNTTKDFQESTTNITNSIRNECGGKLDQNAEFTAADNKVLGDCVFENIEVLNKGGLKVDCVQSAIANSDAISKAQSKIELSATAKNKGLDLAKMMWAFVIVIVVFIIALAYSLPKILDHMAGKNSAVGKLLAIPALSAIGGVVFVVLFFVMQKDTMRMRRSAFSNMCKGASGGKSAGKYTTADAAIAACKGDSSCKAIQYSDGDATVWTDGSFENCKPTSAQSKSVRSACDKCAKAKPCGGREGECPGCYCDVKTVWEVDETALKLAKKLGSEISDDDIVKKQGPAEDCGKKWCDGSPSERCKLDEEPLMANKGECGKPTWDKEKGELVYKPCCVCDTYERRIHCLDFEDRMACARCNMGVSEQVCRASDDPNATIERHLECDGNDLYDCVVNGGSNCDTCAVLDDPDGTVPCGMGRENDSKHQKIHAMAIKRTEKTRNMIFIWFAIALLVISMISSVAIARSGGNKS